MKTKIISGVVACVMLLGLTAFGIASTGGGGSAYKLEGAWIAKVDGSTGQWSYVLSPDSSGRRASGHSHAPRSGDAGGSRDAETP